MPSIGVLAAEHLALGLVDNNQLVGAIRLFPDASNNDLMFGEMPAEEIRQSLVEQIKSLAANQEITSIGIGFPGMIQRGVIEDSPNLQQMKGQHLGDQLSKAFNETGITAPVYILNDADALAAGVAATQGYLDKQIRVWWLGNGIGFGQYPTYAGAGEGGHMVVTLDEKERFCRCGGRGHLEGIMGYHAMRMRFLDMEPDEVFAESIAGDQRCRDFVKLWHRALAAATASSIHLNGAGKFYVSGPNAKYIQHGLLNMYLHEMVKMSPLQGSSIEVITTSDEVAIIGAAVSAAQNT